MASAAGVTAIGSPTTAGANRFTIIFLAILVAFVITFVAVAVWILPQGAGS